MCFPMVNLRVQGTRTNMSGAYGAEIDLTVLEGVRRRRPRKCPGMTEPTYPLTNRGFGRLAGGPWGDGGGAPTEFNLGDIQVNEP